MKKNIITWDLGATKCAASLVSYDPEGMELRTKNICSIKLKNVKSFPELVYFIENDLDIRHQDADCICIGAAGVYDGNVLHLQKGYPFLMNIDEYAKSKKWPAYLVVHDYVPIICASFYPGLKTHDVHTGQPDLLGRRVAFGIGTGLGLKDGVLLPHGGFWLGNNEMGHIGLSAITSVPEHVLSVHRYLCKIGVSFEGVLSGDGMLLLHRYLHRDSHIASPEELGEIIRNDNAEETLRCFAFYVGLFTAVIQLCFMPNGGVWMAGGVLLKHRKLFICPEYLQGLYALGAYQAERNRFPIKIITDDHAAFLGAAYYAIKSLPELA